MNKVDGIALFACAVLWDWRGCQPQTIQWTDTVSN